ncbi:unnamed protein product [Symbiodinium natans]|uniref:Uncharacterized protein n=1 Tax=Symbiodinium natans TaxID=878477 RepID=A0A812TCR6_9DINO|nr:unnamed protein product [Symbiodinium natans]
MMQVLLRYFDALMHFERPEIFQAAWSKSIALQAQKKHKDYWVWSNQPGRPSEIHRRCCRFAIKCCRAWFRQSPFAVSQLVRNLAAFCVDSSSSIHRPCQHFFLILMNEALNMERGNSFKDTVLQETLKIMLKRPDSAVAINFSRRLACDDSIDLDGLAIPAMEQLAALESKARVPGCRKDAADVLYRWRSGVSSYDGSRSFQGWCLSWASFLG